MGDELDQKRQRVETTPGRGKTPAPMEGHPIRRGPEHGFRKGAGGNQPPSRDTRPDRATRFLETTLGTLSYSELAPILAERVLRVDPAGFLESLGGGRCRNRREMEISTDAILLQGTIQKAASSLDFRFDGRS